MPSSGETDRVVAEYERLTEKIRPGATMAAGAAGWEAARSQAYQRMVSFGLAPQIRRKYR